jgi:hypothetical protein
MGNTNGFQGLVGYLKISDYAVGSNFTSTKNKFRSILTTGESLGFSGSEQDVQVTGTRTDWALGDTWTIEWWEKMDADANNFHGVMSQDSNVSPYAGIDVFHANGQIQMFNSAWNFTEPARGVWNHIAIQKNGSTATAYINGVATSVSANMTYGTLSNTSQDLIIGLRSSTGTSPGYSQWFKGQLANIRISSVARYTTTFTPPITVAVDANTVLALDGAPGSTGMLDDVSASNHTITNNGAVVDSAVGYRLTIADDGNGGLVGYNSQALAVAYNADIISKFPVGSTITFQDNATATIIQIDNYAPTAIDIFWDTPKTGTLFPITLKTSDYPL